MTFFNTVVSIFAIFGAGILFVKAKKKALDGLFNRAGLLFFFEEPHRGDRDKDGCHQNDD